MWLSLPSVPGVWPCLRTLVSLLVSRPLRLFKLESQIQSKWALHLFIISSICSCFCVQRAHADSSDLLCHLPVPAERVFLEGAGCLHFHYTWAILMYPSSTSGLNSRATPWRDRIFHLLSLIIGCGFLLSSDCREIAGVDYKIIFLVFSVLYSFPALGNFLWRLIEVLSAFKRLFAILYLTFLPIYIENILKVYNFPESLFKVQVPA